MIYLSNENSYFIDYFKNGKLLNNQKLFVSYESLQTALLKTITLLLLHLYKDSKYASNMIPGTNNYLIFQKLLELEILKQSKCFIC